MKTEAVNYRSERRNRVRIVNPVGSRSASLGVGVLWYGRGAPPFSEMLRDAKGLNRNELLDLYQVESNAIINSLDDLHAYTSFHSWTFNGWVDAIPHEAHDVIFSCFHKSILSLHAAHELTLDGLYGLARPHLRHAFESLMIAKFCAIDPSSDLFDRWIDGVDFYFTNGVLKKIASPNVGEFTVLWSLLCRWSHATVFANQLSLDLETTREEAGLNIVLVGVLLHFSYHLLNTHLLTRTIKYYARRYKRSFKGDDSKERLKYALTTLRANFGPGSRRLIRDFSASWKVR